MQTATKNSFFLTDRFSLNVLADLQTASGQGEFYQQIAKELIKGVYTKQVFNSLGDRLIALAESAYAARRIEAVEEVSRFLLNLPFISQYRNIGRYYGALCLYQRGQLTEARTLLENLAQELPPKFRSKALIAISATFYGRGDFQSFLSLSVEAGNASACRDNYDVQTLITAQRNVALYQSIDGDHRGAVNVLERLLPLVRRVGKWHPYLYYEYLNSLAVELAELGRLEEARNVSRITLASPYASAYSEWRETWDDIQVKGYRISRSVVSLNHSALNLDNVLHLPLQEHNEAAGSEKHTHSPFQQQASITSLQDWKQKMVKKSNGDHKNDKPSSQLDDRKMLLKIVELSTSTGLPDEALQEVVDALENIVKRYTKKDDK